MRRLEERFGQRDVRDHIHRDAVPRVRRELGDWTLLEFTRDHRGMPRIRFLVRPGGRTAETGLRLRKDGTISARFRRERDDYNLMDDHTPVYRDLVGTVSGRLMELTLRNPAIRRAVFRELGHRESAQSMTGFIQEAANRMVEHACRDSLMPSGVRRIGIDEFPKIPRRLIRKHLTRPEILDLAVRLFHGRCEHLKEYNFTVRNEKLIREMLKEETGVIRYFAQQAAGDNLDAQRMSGPQEVRDRVRKHIGLTLDEWRHFGRAEQQHVTHNHRWNDPAGAIRESCRLSVRLEPSILKFQENLRENLRKRDQRCGRPSQEEEDEIRREAANTVERTMDDILAASKLLMERRGGMNGPAWIRALEEYLRIPVEQHELHNLFEMARQAGNDPGDQTGDDPGQTRMEEGPAEERMETAV